jgi:hypothetical protein
MDWAMIGGFITGRSLSVSTKLFCNGAVSISLDSTGIGSSFLLKIPFIRPIKGNLQVARVVYINMA